MTIPRTISMAYRMGALIHREGPMPRDELIRRFDASIRHNVKRQAVTDAIRSAWLIETDGQISLCYTGRVHFKGAQNARSVSANLVPAATPPVFRPLSLKNMPVFCARPGAMDYRDIPSLMSGVRMPFRDTDHSGDEGVNV